MNNIGSRESKRDSYIHGMEKILKEADEQQLELIYSFSRALCRGGE